jgi:hypothetical protein
MAIAVTLFQLDIAASSSTASVSGPQAWIQMLNEQHVFFDQHVALSMTQKCEYLRNLLKLLLDQAMSVPKALHILELSIETTILSMIPIVSKRKNSTRKLSIGGSTSLPTGIVSTGNRYIKFFNYFLGLLHEGNALIYHEIVSRICRKIEYNVCYDIFPLPITRTVGNSSLIESVMGGFQNRGDERMREAETSSLDLMKCKISLVDLFEQSLARQSTWHASRILTLLCEYVGGTESSLSIASCLLLSSELLYRHISTLSLKKAIECIDFIHRLEESQVTIATIITGSVSESPNEPLIHQQDDPLEIILKHITSLRFSMDKEMKANEPSHRDEPLPSKQDMSSQQQQRQNHDDDGISEEARSSIESGEAFFAGFDWILSSLGLISSPVKSYKNQQKVFSNHNNNKKNNNMISDPTKKSIHSIPLPNTVEETKNLLSPGVLSASHSYHYEVAEKLKYELSKEQLQDMFSFLMDNKSSTSILTGTMTTHNKQSIVGYIISIVLKDWWGGSPPHQQPMQNESILSPSSLVTSSSVIPSNISPVSLDKNDPVDLHGIIPSPSTNKTHAHAQTHYQSHKHRHSYASGIFTVLILFANPVTKRCITEHIRSYVKTESDKLLNLLNPEYEGGLHGHGCFVHIDEQTKVEVTFKNILLLFRASRIFSAASSLGTFPVTAVGGDQAQVDNHLTKKKAQKELIIAAQHASILREFAWGLQENVSEQYLRRLMELELHPFGHHTTSSLNMSNHSSSHHHNHHPTLDKEIRRRTSRQYSSDSMTNAAMASVSGSSNVASIHHTSQTSASTVSMSIGATSNIVPGSRQSSCADLSPGGPLLSSDISLPTVVYFDLPGSIEDMEEEIQDDLQELGGLIEEDENYDPSQHPLALFFQEELLRHPRGSQRLLCNDRSVMTSSTRHYTIFHILRSVMICALLTKQFSLAWYVILQLRHCFPNEVNEMIVGVHRDLKNGESPMDKEAVVQSLCDIFIEFVLQ